MIQNNNYTTSYDCFKSKDSDSKIIIQKMITSLGLNTVLIFQKGDQAICSK